MMRANSYDPKARVPKIGSRWVWEIDKPAARELIEVTEVLWNGEEWWVRTKMLLGRGVIFSPGGALNDLSRFWEAVTPVGGTVSRMSEVRPALVAPSLAY